MLPWGRIPPWVFNGLAVSFAFSTYFCMYAFRKPFAAGSFTGTGWFELDLKTTLVIGQVIGYALSKYLGIKLVSEALRHRRLPLLIGLVVFSELALIGLPLLPHQLKPLALFCNGLPLGMVWGLVVRTLEGRRASDLLLAGLSCSFIVASGVVKDVGRWVLSLGVSELWMPAAVGVLFLVPFVVSATLLDALPEPDSLDRETRTAREVMGGSERRRFLREFWPGVLLLLLLYLALTGFRDFRDNYGVELFAELGYVQQAALFTRTELPVALLVLLSLGGISLIRDARAALAAVFSAMFVGLVLLGVATYLLQQQAISGELWMIAMGLGGYLAYVPFGSFLFDHIMASTRFVGTAVFAINLADAIGYTGSVALQIYKDFAAGAQSRLSFFIMLTYVLSVGGAGLLLIVAVYFLRRARGAQPAFPQG